jgi:hypothetical protein
VDTCCINKANWTELAEAINSMYQWYRDAAKCYVYLSDVSVETWVQNFGKSRWFGRGWTLQELLAPTLVEFYSNEGVFLGDKESLELQIHRSTSIPVAALRGQPLSEFAVSERKQWVARRNTKRVEDKAYCMLGIFGVFLPLIYGEGANSWKRLEEEIEKSSESEPLENRQKRNSCQRSESKTALRSVTESQAGLYAPFLDVLLQLAEVPEDDRTRKAMLHCVRLLSIMDSAKFIWGNRDAVDQRTVNAIDKAQKRLRDTYYGAVTRCYKSLGFDDIMAREEIIAAPDDETCLWIYDTPEFQSWHSDQKPLLWLKGTFPFYYCKLSKSDP